jgi:cold shock protein
MKTGTIKFFNKTKGFGFIKPDDATDDVFVHHTSLLEEVTQNDKVSFEITDGKKGKNAVNVKRT